MEKIIESSEGAFKPQVEPLEINGQHLDSARLKAYIRLIPMLFICYIIAYVDRTNVGVAKLTMAEDLPTFDSMAFGFGNGIYFIGYFLL